MRFLQRLLLAGFTLQAIMLLPNAAAADQTTTAPTAAPTADPALTARFASFMSGILAGEFPASGVTDKMKAAFTPSAIDQVKTAFSPLGNFQKLEFTREDSVTGYTRFHYIAIFDKGTQPVIFVLDSNQNIAGFFADQGQ